MIAEDLSSYPLTILHDHENARVGVALLRQEAGAVGARRCGVGHITRQCGVGHIS
jgi:hypothetical protein